MTYHGRGTTTLRATGALLAAALVAGLAVASIPAAAQAPTLPGDSLAALDALVSKAGDHCTLADAADDDVGSDGAANDVLLPYVFCDDGIPPSGGGANGIPVPVAYRSNARGDDFSGLPRPADPEQAAEKAARHDLRPESTGDRITLDVDITLPASVGIAREYGRPWRRVAAPKGGFPVIALMHGCCGGNKSSWEATTTDAAGESWHQSNAWFAARGYVVVNYTARGFRNGNDQGSTGTTQLDSRRYEINDYQYLVGLLADHDAQRRAAAKRPIFNINPKKVAAVGGSYGGGFSWLALTDPTWRSPIARTRIRLRAAAPRYGWTDLLEALVPSGHYLDKDFATRKTVVPPSAVGKAPSLRPLGVQKQSIVTLLYSSGNLMNTDHTTFPAYLHSAYERLQQGEPYDDDEELQALAKSFLSDRSAYYQSRFWKRVRKGLRVPAFIAATWTDPLFTAGESGVRFYNKLTRIAPRYPVQMYLGDYQHFVANKPKEWNDMCGDDHHVCTIDDYTRSDGTLNLNSSPKRVRVGATTRMNRFLDHYLRGAGKTPPRTVSATTTICAANATDKLPVDEPGIEYRAKSWQALAPNTKRFAWKGGGVATTTTLSTAIDNHASESDPGFRFAHPNKCFTTSSVAPAPGVVHYTDVVTDTFTLMGMPAVKLTYEANAPDGQYWIAARLYDVDASGTATMVTRGICRVATAAAPDVTCEIFELWGNGWTFEKGHSIVLELTQADTPTFRRNNFQSSIQFQAAELKLPVTTSTRRKDFRF